MWHQDTPSLLRPLVQCTSKGSWAHKDSPTTPCVLTNPTKEKERAIVAKSTAVETTMEAPYYTRTASLSIPLPQHLETLNLKKIVSLDNIQNSPSHQLLPTRGLHHVGSSRRESLVERLITSKDIVDISVSHTLIIRKGPHSRPLGPGKGSSARTLCSHPASPIPVQILNSPTLRHVLKSNI